MLIAEELLLLALDDETGKRMIGKDRLVPALGGALVAELLLLERVGVTPHGSGWTKRGRITITNLKPTDDPELDLMLERLAEREGKKLKDSLSEASIGGAGVTRDVLPRILDRLVRAGALTPQRNHVLGILPRTTWPSADPAREDDVRQRLQAALVHGLTPSERTVALVALLHVVGLVNKVIHTEDRATVRRRAKELAEGDVVAAAVRQAIEAAAASG